MSDTVLDDQPRRKDGATEEPCKRAPHDRWALELARLASQHHTSEYNRLKYGHRGSPTPYAPLSLHLPDVVRTLRERQETYAGQPPWWPCPSTSPTPANTESSPVIPAAKQRAALATGESIPHPDLQRQLSIAISESITPPRPQSSHQTDTHNPALHTKTSETHPINISQIIPPESLVAISSHLMPCKKPCPVLFEIILPCGPDLIARYPQLFPSEVLPVCSTSVPAVLPPSQHKRLSSNELRSSVAGALNVALNTKLSLSPLQVPSSRILLSLKRTLKNHSVSDAASEHDVADAIPKSAPRHSTFPFAQTVSPTSQGRLPSLLALPTTYALHPFSPHVRPPTAPSPPHKISKLRASKPSSIASSGQGTANRRPLKLGNLLLSSCPGKKVRLNGPVRGRSAVCRDLDVDLRRMKMLGARCVVCCLDDEELEFLVGASWIEYCQMAHREGLDILRIPLPEGLTPLSPKALDADLDWIIERYTLQGTSVLVHCRGGVGRAGLLACCWMLKLGLCGWVEDVTPSAATVASASESKHDDAPSETFRWDSETVVRRDTLQMVERVIEVIRRRRSVKAIETLEQVQFLVEYVDYLRACGRTGRVSCSSPLPP